MPVTHDDNYRRANLKVIESVAEKQEKTRQEWTVTLEAELGTVSMTAASCTVVLRVPYEHRHSVLTLTDAYGDLVNVTISTKGAESGG